MYVKDNREPGCVKGRKLKALEKIDRGAKVRLETI